MLEGIPQISRAIHEATGPRGTVGGCVRAAVGRDSGALTRAAVPCFALLLPRQQELRCRGNSRSSSIVALSSVPRFSRQVATIGLRLKLMSRDAGLSSAYEAASA